MPRFRIRRLSDDDLAHLREIVDRGALSGEVDVLRMVKFIASALLVVGDGQQQTLEMLQKVSDKPGPGR